MANYTNDEIVLLNKDLEKWKTRAKRLILSNYYDSVKLSEIQYSVLSKVTNADSYKDISSYLWNSGMIEKTLDCISEQLADIRKKSK